MYLEIRGIPAGGAAEGLAESAAFCLHRLDLRPDLNSIRLGLHANCVRRKIARAERESLVYEEGRSEALLQKFYTLAVLTRRRHRLPPHPVAWFRNLIASLGDGLQIRVASHKGRPAAAILTLRYKRTMTYKYGTSDSRLHNLGATQLLLWSAIQEAKRDGMLEFDLGRTEWGNEGLLVFKDRWGAARFPIAYLRYPAPTVQRNVGGLKIRIARQIFALAPARLLTTAGNVLYRHMA
jgi:lipid II:glycine glycyltransferase (peptidoglycan interpeptide bridge formation enzyme)